jgi:hypothetical protein
MAACPNQVSGAPKTKGPTGRKADEVRARGGYRLDPLPRRALVAVYTSHSAFTAAASVNRSEGYGFDTDDDK